MKITRSLAVVALGALLFLVTWWIGNILAATIGVHYGNAANNLSSLPGWLDLVHKLLPGLVVGYVAAARPALHSAVSTALGALFLSLFAYGADPASVLNGIGLAGVTGAVSGLAGAYIRARSNNSFNPMPLRGTG